MKNKPFPLSNLRIIRSILETYRRESFLPTFLSIVINPVYIVRTGLQKSISYHAPEITGKVLDFGCGTKPYEALFINASSYVGVDIELQDQTYRNSKADFYYDGKILPFSDSEFDAVVCFETVEHIFNIDDIFQEINRVLKPKGRILITSPFGWGEHETDLRYTILGLSIYLKKVVLKLKSPKQAVIF